MSFERLVNRTNPFWLFGTGGFLIAMVFIGLVGAANFDAYRYGLHTGLTMAMLGYLGMLVAAVCAMLHGMANEGTEITNMGLGFAASLPTLFPALWWSSKLAIG